jgi:hypothetical protein
LVGRSALDEYREPTDQLIAAIANAIIPTNSSLILEVSISALHANFILEYQVLRLYMEDQAMIHLQRSR